MTFRLVNAGCREVWHDTEFLYHTCAAWLSESDGMTRMLGQGSLSAPPSTITVVVDAGAVARHLRWLVAAGVLPPIELRVIRSEAEARDTSEQIRLRTAEQAVIGRLCFARYRGMFGPIDPAGRVVVV